MIQATEKLSIAQFPPQEDMRTWTNMPDDVLANILTRLPAKQLTQLRRVSKAWNALLSEPHFIKTHLGHQRSNNNDEILLVFFRNDGFSVNPSRSPDIDLTTSFIKLPYPDFPSKCTVIGSVNGLICFSRRYSSRGNDYLIHIWNPSLSALMTLPPYTSRTRPPHFETLLQDKFFFRFGFDPKSDDHKLVLFTTCFDLRINKPSFPDYLQVEVYSTKKGSWNLITQKFPLDVEVLDHQNADCMDGYAGFLHWLCDVTPPIGVSLPWGLFYETIVAFDLSLETFSEIPLPDAMFDCYESTNITLGVLAGKICVMALSLVNEALEVWVLDEHGVAESWVKNHVFSGFTGYSYGYGFTLNNEFLFQTFICERLALYDPVAAKVKYFKDFLPRNHDEKVKFVSYVESLVWVAPTKPSVTT